MTATPNAPLLAVRDVTVTITKGKRQTDAVTGIDFDVAAGEIVAIVGETGSGKSLSALSVLQLIRDPVRLTQGSVLLQGQDLTGLKPADLRRVRGGDIGMIFQDPMTALNPFHTVGQQIGEAMTVHRKLSREAVRERTLRLLGDVGIVNPRQRIDQYPHELSGGTQQRVMIAMALANEPKLLIADEPTTGLDVTVQAQILRLVREAAVSWGMGVLLITHDLGVVAGYSDRVVVMYAGNVVESGPTEEVLAAPAHPYTRALLDARPENGRPGMRLNAISGGPPELFKFPVGCRFQPRCANATAECGAANPALVPPPKASKDGPVPKASTDRLVPKASTDRLVPKASKDRLVRCIHPYASPAPSDPARSSGVSISLPPAPAEPGAPAIRVEALRRVFAGGGHVTKAVDGVDLQLAFGETLGIVGESGCGKSTTARILAGLDQPSDGLIRYADGRELTHRRGRVDHTFVQYVFQDTFGSLNPRRTVWQIIEEPLKRLTDLSKAQRAKRIREYMAECGLMPSIESRYPHELSGGQRQRVGICRALVVQPKVVVMDEPMSGLDLSVQAQIINLLQDLKKDLGLTAVLVSHDISVIRHLCDRVAVMYLGRVVEAGPASTLLTSPLHPYTAALLSAVPQLETEARRPEIPLRGDAGDVDPASACGFAPRCPIARPECRTDELRLTPQRNGLLVACHYPGQFDQA
ncbi:dipeptide ABC transporter ATP-binding protein [Dactylosporangium sp. NPDC000521]|uniref:dipeptide ABC transporter ATP-binding protein n=1 Tax=Dactylosporangium sp. NPDC000521 TaxID=3363975 RepID=UPI003688ECA6